MTELCVPIKEELECWRPHWKCAASAACAATHVWDHYLANDINEFVQPAAAVQFHHHSVLWENVKSIS